MPHLVEFLKSLRSSFCSPPKSLNKQLRVLKHLLDHPWQMRRQHWRNRASTSRKVPGLTWTNWMMPGWVAQMKERMDGWLGLEWANFCNISKLAICKVFMIKVWHVDMLDIPVAGCVFSRHSLGPKIWGLDVFPEAWMLGLKQQAVTKQGLAASCFCFTCQHFMSIIILLNKAHLHSTWKIGGTFPSLKLT